MLRMRFIFIFMITSFVVTSAQAQKRITGTVLSSVDEKALSGVSVIKKGSNVGTATDANGNFSIPAATGETLVFSYLGFVTREVELRNDQPLMVRLDVSNSTLNEVVVTALGIKREKKALGYSVGEVKGDELTETNQGNVLNAMAGRVAGVRISQMDGTPGSSVNIIIRGATSLSNDNQPLFVIDGVPVMNQLDNSYQGADLGNAISDLNPNDIESVSVLKGASAAALYGSRAGNGVILITTKSKRKKGLGVSLNSSYVNDIPYNYLPVQDKFGTGKAGAHVFQEGENEQWGPQLDAGELWAQWNSKGEKVPLVSYPNRFTDFFRNGQTFNNNLSVNGNYDKGYFRLSAGDMRNTGVIPNTDLKRTTVNLNSSYQLTKKLSVTASFNWNETGSGNRPNVDGDDRNDIVRGLYYIGAQVNINDLKNYWLPGQEGIQQLKNAPKMNNPWFLAHENTNSFLRDRLISKVQLDWELGNNWNLMGRFSRDAFQEGRESKKAFSTYGQEQGGYDVANLNRKETNLEINLSYHRSLGKDWKLNAMVGGNNMYRRGNTMDNVAAQLIIPDLYTISNGVPGTVIYNSSWNQKAIYSVYGTSSIAYKEMVYLEVTGRNDWSSTLPADNRSYFYPSSSLSILFSEIFKLPTWINFGKLRGGVAQVGNDTNPYSSKQYFSVGPDWGTAKQLYMGGSMTNPSLQPERATSKEIGMELKLLKNRVGLEATWYVSRNRNQILSIGLPVESGATSRVINTGLIESKGWEISLYTNPISTKNFRWDLNFNFTRNETRLKELAEGLTNFEFANTNGAYVRTYEGGLIGDIYENPMLKVTDKSSPYFGYPLLSASGLYQNDNDPAHIKKIGNSNQDFTLGIQPSFTYKAFSLSANIDWNQGGQFYSGTMMFMQNDGRRIDTYSGAPYNKDKDISTQIKENPEAFFGNWVGGRTAEYGGFPWPSQNGRLEDASFNVGVREVVDANGNKSFVENLGGAGTVWLDPFTANRYANRPFPDRNLYDATYIKVREIALSYHIPMKLVQQMHIQNATIAIISANPFEWTAAGNHIDPERAYKLNGGAWSQGIEYYNTMPWITSLGFKLNVEF